MNRFRIYDGGKTGMSPLLPYICPGGSCYLRLLLNGTEPSASEYSLFVTPISASFGLACWLLEDLLPAYLAATAPNDISFHEETLFSALNIFLRTTNLVFFV